MNSVSNYIALALSKATYAVELTFIAGVIKSFPGFNVSIFYRGEDAYSNTEVQTFSFQCAVADVVALAIAIGDEFTMTDLANSQKYTFRVSQTPRHDMYGWCQLVADFISR